MSNTDEFDDIEDGADATNLVKDLRKQVKAKGDELAELRKELDGFRASARATSVADVLKAKSTDETERARLAKFAKFYTSEDSSEEAVNAWITENADLIGLGSVDQGADEETITAAARVSQSLAVAPPSRAGTAEALLAEFASTDDPKRYAELKTELAKIAPAHLR